jgi:adenylosuccinate lyase
MLSRTHGQAASPTTIGKELANFAYRINMILKNISGNNLKGKFNGAVGNFNAHTAAYPELEWPKITKNFIEKLGLKVSEYSTQVEDKDSLAELMSSYVRLNNILIDFSRDCWGYISLGYFSLKLKKGEVGSSTMPHKVNPIDFENAEGNLGISNANFQHISNKVVISRWQRDLSDSTVLRNIGNCFALSLIAYESLLKGLIKLEINKVKIKLDLENCWELITEAIQTVMRKNNLPEGYELMKSFSRGKEINKKDIQNLINGLDISKIDKDTLLQLTPLKYIGLAGVLAKKI